MTREGSKPAWLWWAVGGVAAAVVAALAVGGRTVVKSQSTKPIDTLEGLDPEFRSKLDQLVKALEARGYKPWIYETIRTQARQDWLYASGRTRPGPIVTDVREPTDKGHGAGKAADIIDGRPHPTRKGQRVGWGSWTGDPGDDEAAEMAADYFQAQGEEAERLGLVWGGRWTLSGGGKDEPHVQLA